MLEVQPLIAKTKNDSLSLFSAGVVLVIFSALFSRQLILGHIPIKLCALVMCIFGAAYLLKSRVLRISEGMAVLFLLAIFPPILHGYINLGLLFHVITALVICSVGFELERVLRSGIFFVVVLYFFTLLGFSFTGDMSFVRNLNFPSDIYNYMSFANPNVLSRIVLIMIPILFMSYSVGVLSKKFLILLLLGALIIIAIVTGSRANLLALMVMLSYWFFVQKEFSGRYSYLSRSVVVFGLASSLLFLPGVSNKVERGYLILTETQRLLETSTHSSLDEGLAPARSKTWAAAILLIEQSPWVGVGPNADQLVSEMGAKNQAGESIAVHGGMMNIVTSTGLIGLCMFLIAITLLYRKLGIYGRMLLIGALVSQVGADIYSQTIFWIILGICLFFDEKSEKFRVDKKSMSHFTLSDA